MNKKLSDLGNNDKIFCIDFYCERIYHADYVEITFNKEKGSQTNYTNYSTKHATKPMGCSSNLEDVRMNNHCFLDEFSSSVRFFTLRKETWQTDLQIEMDFLIEMKKRQVFEECTLLKNDVNALINSNPTI